MLEEIDQAREHFICFIEDMLKTGQEKGYLKEIDIRLAAISLIGQIDNLCNYYLKNSKTGITKKQLVDTMDSILSSGLLAEKK